MPKTNLEDYVLTTGEILADIAHSTDKKFKVLMADNIKMMEQLDQLLKLLKETPHMAPTTTPTTTPTTK